MELTIKTKFDYEDKVWFMNHNMPRTGYVKKVEVKASSYNNELIGSVEIYTIADSCKNDVEQRQFHAGELFATELELCQSLFYNCIKKD